jgi:hypothetical protein
MGDFGWIVDCDCGGYEIFLGGCHRVDVLCVGVMCDVLLSLVACVRACRKLRGGKPAKKR